MTVGAEGAGGTFPELSAGRTAEQTMLVMVITAVTSIVGFAREAAFADRLGASGAADAWATAAMVLAVTTEFLVMAGPVSTLIIPMLAERRIRQGRDAERRAFLAFVLVAAAAGLLLSAVVVSAANPLSLILAPGFDAARHATLETLLRFVGAALFPIAMAGALGAGLAAARKFAGPSLYALAMHIAVLASLLFLFPRIGPVAVGWGVLVGSILMASLQIGALDDPGLAGPPDFAAVRQAALMALPVAGVFAMREGTLFLERLFASALPEGVLSTLYYASKLEQLPLGLFAVTVAVVAFPDMAELGIAGRLDEMAQALGRGLRIVFLLSVPSALGLAVLAKPIVRLLFEHGRFDSADTAAVARVLTIISIGLIGQSAIPSLIRGYFSLRKPHEPLRILGVVLAVNALLDWALLSFGATGLATAFSITMTLNALGLALLLARRIPLRGALGVSRLVPVVALAALALSGAAWGVHAGLDALVGHATLGARALATLSAVTAGALVYVIVVWIARVPEVMRIGSRMRKKKADAGTDADEMGE
jgi:putative peptidoglycan lipid II flippase